MSINNTESMHGVVALRLWRLYQLNSLVNFSLFLDAASRPIVLTQYNQQILAKEKVSAGLFIKISTARRSPWRYTFAREHQRNPGAVQKVWASICLFVAGLDGITCVDYRLLKQLLDEVFEDQEESAFLENQGVSGIR